MGIIIMEATLSYLRFNCIWPRKSEELNAGKSYYIRFILMIISTCIPLIGSICHLVVITILSNATYNLTEDLITITAEIGVYYFICIFLPHQRQASKLFLKLSQFDRFGEPPEFRIFNRKLTMLSRVYKTTIDAVIFSYFIEPFFSREACEALNKTREVQEFCGLVLTTWLPLDLNKSPTRQILYVWQTYSLLMTLKGAAALSFLVMETMEHLVVRIRHLKVLLQQSINTVNDDLRRDRLINCILYHTEIFRLGEEIDQCFATGLFVHTAITGILFGVIGFSFLYGITVKTMSLFVGWFLSLYIVSISGQDLLNEASSVGDTIYNCRWYDRDVAFQKNIAFMIQRAQRPIKIHAGPFSYLSHVFILTILKTAYSYMTLLKASSK